MGVWQGVAMDSLKFYQGPPQPTLLHPAGGPPLIPPYGRFLGGLPTRLAASSRLLPLWIPHTVRQCPTFLLGEGFFDCAYRHG
jgi:hypothetical protein